MTSNRFVLRLASLTLASALTSVLSPSESYASSPIGTNTLPDFYYSLSGAWQGVSSIYTDPNYLDDGGLCDGPVCGNYTESGDSAASTGRLPSEGFSAILPTFFSENELGQTNLYSETAAAFWGDGVTHPIGASVILDDPATAPEAEFDAYSIATADAKLGYFFEVTSPTSEIIPLNLIYAFAVTYTQTDPNNGFSMGVTEGTATVFVSNAVDSSVTYLDELSDGIEIVNTTLNIEINDIYQITSDAFATGVGGESVSVISDPVVTLGSGISPLDQLIRSPNLLSPADVPEPSTWAMMLVGFGGLGTAMRSRRKMFATA